MNKFTMLNFKQYWQSMLEQRWVPYYQSLAEREQRILLFASVVLPVVLFVFMVILPLNDAQNNKKASLQLLQKEVHDAELLAVRLQAQGGSAFVDSNA